ncbi:MAG: helix-turn-helix domain-containing protein [Lachnospiraceae bacterium]
MNLRTFYIDYQIDYEELLCEDEIIQKFYLIRNKNHNPFVTIPDGCTDVQFLFEKNKKDACISGSVEIPHISHHIGKDWIFGVKLNPGIIPVMVSEKDAKILDRHIDISGQEDIAEILNRLEKTDSLSSMAAIVKKPVENMISGRINPVAGYALQEIIEQEGCVKMAQIADGMKYSQHYINREFKKNTGFSLKQYAEIIRLQSAITYLETSKTDMVYEQLGYYDQAHFIKEFKKYTLLTPQNYMKRSLQKILV